MAQDKDAPIVFLGGMDKDSDPRVVSEGDWTDALNIHTAVSTASNEATATNVKGNLEIINPYLFNGTNKSISTYEDNVGDSIIYCIQNSLGHHGIFRYYRHKGTYPLGVIEPLLQIRYPYLYTITKDPLNFQEEKYITGIDLVDNYLFITDHFNRPRMIDVSRANNIGKRWKFNLYFDQTLLTGTPFIYQLVLSDSNGNTPSTLGWTSVATTLVDAVQEFITAYRADLIATSSYYVEDHNNYVTIEMATTGEFFLAFTNFLTQARVGKVTPANFYPDAQPGNPNCSWNAMPADLIDRIKYPPTFEPTVIYATDTTREVNLVRDHAFQFRAQYVYFDNAKSVWGPISNIAIPRQVCDPAAIGIVDNYLEVDFTDFRLNDPQLSSIITKVNIAVREHDEGDWQLFVTLEAWQWGMVNNRYRFYNDEIYQPVDQVEANLPYDSIGKVVKSQKYLEQRLFDGGIVEGYNPIDVNAKLTVNYNEAALKQQELFTIKGAVHIRKIIGDTANYNQPIWTVEGNTTTSQCPSCTQDIIAYGGFADNNTQGNVLVDVVQRAVQDGGGARQVFPNSASCCEDGGLQGFVLYLAGTPYYGITRQYLYRTNGGQPAQQYGSGNYFTASTGTDRSTIESDMTSYFTNRAYNRDPFGLGEGATSPNGGGLLGEDDSAPRSNIFSYFEIRNVPPGKYVLRMASHTDTYLKDLSDSSLSYQQTSESVLEIGGQPGFEIVVEVDAAHAFGGTQNIYVGRSIIADLSYLPALSGYITDHDNPNAIIGDYESMLAETRIEKAVANFSKGPYVIGSIVPRYITYPASPLYWWWHYGQAITDHNGYFFFCPANTDSPPLSVTSAVSGNVAMVLTSYRADNVANAVVTTTGNLAGKWNSVVTGVWRNSEDNVSKYSRTNLDGRVVNAGTTLGVPNVNVCNTHGAWQHTDPQGDFLIHCYVDTLQFFITGALIRADIVIINTGLSQCRFEQPYIDIWPYNIPIDQNPGTVPPPYEASDPIFYYPIPPFLIVILNLVVSDYGWKHGNDIQFGIVYFDEADRRTPVCTDDNLRLHIPFYNEIDIITGLPVSPGIPQISWEVFNRPPQWATKYRWVRTLNQQLNFYVEWAVNTVQYVSDDLTTVVGQALARFILIDISNFDKFVELHPNTTIAYTFEKGDRIRFMKDASGIDFGKYYDYEILQVIQTVGINYIVLENDVNLPILGPGDTYELYTPRLDSNERIFYEFGETYLIDARTQNGLLEYVHTGLSQDQQFLPAPAGLLTSIPATGTFITGDAYFRERVIPIGTGFTAPPPIIQDPRISDYFDSEDQSIGRVHSVDEIGEVVRDTAIRFSDRYIPGSKVNGLTRFQALNQKDLNHNYGLINRFMLIGDDVLQCECDNSKIVSMYVNKNLLRQNVATTDLLVALSNEVLPQSNILQRTLGTQNPESVVINDYQDVFMWDKNLNAVVRYTGNELREIDKVKLRYFFNDIAESQKNFPNQFVKTVAVYDRRRDEYVITFNNIQKITAHKASATICLPEIDTATTFSITIQPFNVVFPPFVITPVVSGSVAIATVISNATGWTYTIDAVTGCVTIYAPIGGTLYNNATIILTFQPQNINLSYKMEGGTDA